MSTDKAKTAEVPVVAARITEVNGHKWLYDYVPWVEKGVVVDALVKQSEHLAAMEALRQERQSVIEAERASWLKQEAQSTAEVLALRAEVAARDARIAELTVQQSQCVQDAERYRLLRCFRLSGGWPRDGQSLGLVAFSARYDDEFQYTQGNLDHMLDEYLGRRIPSSRPLRKDWVEWQKDHTKKAVESVGGSLVHPDDAAKAGAAIGNNFDPMR